MSSTNPDAVTAAINTKCFPKQKILIALEWKSAVGNARHAMSTAAAAVAG